MTCKRKSTIKAILMYSKQQKSIRRDSGDTIGELHRVQTCFGPSMDPTESKNRPYDFWVSIRLQISFFSNVFSTHSYGNTKD